MSVESNPESADTESMSAPTVEALLTPGPSEVTPRRPRLLGLLSGSKAKSVWAMADQGMASVGNFATAALIGRSIAVRQFGAYGMLTEIFLFLNSIQSALVVYPLSIRGAVLEEGALRRLATGCLLATAVLCIPLTLAMAGVTAIFTSFSSLLFWVPMALIFQQLQETVRRTLLARLRFKEALPGDSISYVGQAFVFWCIGDRLTLPIVFAVMAGTSALALVVQALQIGLRAFPLNEFKALVIDFWGVSRWLLYSNLSMLVAGLSYNWTLALRWGLTPVAYFAVIAQMIKLVNPIQSAISNLIIPSVARAKAGAGTRFAMRVGLRYSIAGAAIVFPYFATLFIFPVFCIRLLYRSKHPEYFDLGGYLRILLAAQTIAYVNNMVLAILNGLGYSRANFTSTATNAVISILIALPLTYALGLRGLVIGGLIAISGATVSAVYNFVRHHDDATDHLVQVSDKSALNP